MPNYENGKIYKICSYNSDDVYYGSTCLKLCQRLAKHVSDWRLFKLKKTYVRRITSFSILEQGNYYIELVETVPCSSKEELQVREKYWLKNNTCVNFYKNLVRTPKEKKKHDAAYYQDNKEAWREKGIIYRGLNKDIIKIKKKEYSERNAEKMKIHNREYILCDCGKYYTRGHRKRHIESDYHKENVNLVMFSQFLDL